MKLLTELLSQLNLPKLHPIKRGMSRTNRSLMYKLQAENRKIKKERKSILSKYRIGSYREYEGDGYFIKGIYEYRGEQYG